MKPATSWMWRDEDGGVQGADLNLEQRVVRWYEAMACACEDNKLEQTFEDYLRRGAHYADPPQAIEDEIRASVLALLAMDA